MPNRVLIDSNFLIALHNLRDDNHIEAVVFSQEDKSIRIIPDIVLAETAYLLRQTMGQHGVLAFLDTLVASDAMLEPISKDDLNRAREIMATYDTADFDLADCCIMALAERLNITQVCTFDHRDFSIFRPRHCEYLELLP